MRPICRTTRVTVEGATILAGVNDRSFNFSDMDGYAGGTDLELMRSAYVNNAPIGFNGIDSYDTQVIGPHLVVRVEC